jgi:4-amino-4-deoxy-L-arabinose transferase-like glycosyltransferase/membrane-associated phospholipid phosphatase
MVWLQTLDVRLFQFINHTLSNPVLDVVMPFFSGNRLFVPALVVLAVLLLKKGGVRGRVFLVVLALVLAAGDILLISMLKQVIGRPRPFTDMSAVQVLAGRPSNGSMPSSHTSTWFAAALIAYVYYRRSWRFMLPLAGMVALSRIYVGAHYPADVLVGAMVGAGYAALGVWGLNWLWQEAGPRHFPAWHARLPSLLQPVVVEPDNRAGARPQASADREWIHLGYVVIGVMLLTRLAFIASDRIELSKDEAYQWLWSKHLALSYYSKPPLIAYTQALSTFVWGDSAFGVRFFSPVIGALLSWLMLRFLAGLTTGRTAFVFVLLLLTTPLLGVGSTLLTIDPLLVLFWTLAMILGWRALRAGSSSGDWMWVGLAMGLGVLSKYTALLQLACWAIFFALCRGARPHLRRSGPWLALLVALLCLTPVLIWNWQHGWITLSHVAENASLNRKWQPTLNYFWDFLFAQLALLNPFYLIGALWAAVAIWKRPALRAATQAGPGGLRGRELILFLFSMGTPVFVGHWLFTLYGRVQPNWIAPAVVPMFCLMVLYWEARWREGARGIQNWLAGGLVLGTLAAVVLHEPKVVTRLAGRALTPDKDPLRRVRAWKETAKLVDEGRQRLLAEGRPTFILVHHYGITGLLSFYLPEARAALGTTPLVYSEVGSMPRDQFFFWPEYRYRNSRQGQNALYVVELDPPQYPLGAWFRSIFTKEPDPPPGIRQPVNIPKDLLARFESVKDLGVQPVYYRGRIYRWLQLMECRNLR